MLKILIIFFIVIVSTILAWNTIVKTNYKTLALVIKWLGLILAIILAILIFIVGKWHLAPFVLTFLVPWFSRLSRYGRIFLFLFPFLSRMSFFRQNNFSSANRNYANSTKMSKKEACEILGLDENSTKEEVENAYKRIMSNYHPDKGGSSYLASKINAARDLLINE